VRRVPSNGIVIADGKYEEGTVTHLWTLGVASFRKRSGAVRIALEKFFPFRDNIDLLGRAGVAAVIQPGGSVSDPDIVAAADEYGMTMGITHVRAFKH
jgi:phosphoribosylaminoimidazolecarboxamide formyltransferase/IMP cyclohydrolase